ncbi:MAG TPA: hypothetical protein VHC22_30705 [Pirellulales bacterium]|nr:hypothetical protein [Pirellulales bacterium]
MTALAPLIAILFLQAASDDAPARQSIRIIKIEPPNPAIRGTAVTLRLAGLDEKDSELFVFLSEATPHGGPADISRNRPSRKDEVIAASITANPAGCTFTLPVTLTLGEYYVGVSRSATEPPQERAELFVIRDPNVRLAVTSVYPSTAFPDK